MIVLIVVVHLDLPVVAVNGAVIVVVDAAATHIVVVVAIVVVTVNVIVVVEISWAHIVRRGEEICAFAPTPTYVVLTVEHR